MHCSVDRALHSKNANACTAASSRAQQRRVLWSACQYSCWMTSRAPFLHLRTACCSADCCPLQSGSKVRARADLLASMRPIDWRASALHNLLPGTAYTHSLLVAGVEDLVSGPCALQLTGVYLLLPVGRAGWHCQKLTFERVIVVTIHYFVASSAATACRLCCKRGSSVADDD